MPELEKYDEREFEDKYKPIDARPDEGLWTWAEVRAAKIPTERVWTVVETGDPEDGSWYAVPGFHIVNKIDYVVTEVPWEHENIEGVWFLDDFDKE